MVVKDRVGRKRYITFEMEGPREWVPERRDVIHAINIGARAAEIEPPRLTVLAGRKGIVMVAHILKDRAIGMLTDITTVGGMDVKVRTVRTSGTIRKAKELGGLADL